MNAFNIMKYHWRRQRVLMLIIIIATIAMALFSFFMMMRYTYEVRTVMNAQGVIEQQATYGNMSDPSSVLNPSVFSMLVVFLSIYTIRKDREFLVSCSVPRYRIWMGTCLFLIATAIGLVLIGGMIAPMLCRIVLLLFGFPLAGGWSASSICLGGDQNLPRHMLMALMNMIGSAGGWMLFGYLMLRWWKIILILLGAMIVGLIVMIQMVRWESVFTQYMREFADKIQFLFDHLERFMKNFMSDESRMRRAVYAMCSGFVGMILSYPIMRGIKVT